MPQVKPKVGDKYLIKDRYITKGGDDFVIQMERWKKAPLVVRGLWEDETYIWAGETREWLIRVEDLITFKPVKLENK